MPASNWIQHVKEFAQKHNMPFGKALRSAAKTYKKQGTASGRRTRHKKTRGTRRHRGKRRF